MYPKLLMINNCFRAHLLGLLCILTLTTYAQPLPARKDSLTSSILHETRFLQIVLPSKYKPGSAEKYDVLYVLDGDNNTTLASEIQQFMESESLIPPMIVVGVLNTDRNRDFLPTHNDEINTSGSADKFFDFIKQELIPYVNKTYPSNGDNTLFGHSFGGVFVTYAMLKDPALFKSYIAADPSHWWDNNAMIKSTPSLLPQLANIEQTFFISGRDGYPFKGMGIAAMDSVLKKSVPPGFKWKLSVNPDETHGSVKLKSLYDGLRFSYANYDNTPLPVQPMGGIILKDEPMPLWFYSDTLRVRYTLDGSEPSMNSLRMKYENTISSSAKLKVTRFGNRTRYIRTFSGEYVAGTYLIPEKKQKDMQPGGFNYAYYEGSWDKLQDFKFTKAAKSGRTDSVFAVEKLPIDKNFVLVISGQLKIREDGYYVFTTRADNQSRLYIGERKLIDDIDSQSNSNRAITFMVPLKKGFYSFSEEYLHHKDDHKLEIEYITPSGMPGKNSVPIPYNVQYGTRKRLY